jgi:hypothetical protein
VVTLGGVISLAEIGLFIAKLLAGELALGQYAFPVPSPA